MTLLQKPVRRVTNDELPANAGADRNRRIVVTLVPGNGKDVPDMIELRPSKTRRARQAALVDVWNYLVRCEVNAKRLEKARAVKARKQEARERRRSMRIITGGLHHA